MASIIVPALIAYAFKGYYLTGYTRAVNRKSDFNVKNNFIIIRNNDTTCKMQRGLSNI
jgi:hypothetical protein|tara:strand:- start:3570 stop:3743 length:174 start_codon:yes stop_codon:yes gene_type:complete